MDEIVAKALLKWPNVPDCYGWLGLDARGDWYLRDADVQQAGAFTSGLQGTRGTRLVHAGLIAFIQRNYARAADGAWYFQNGPQRVFVELAAAPWTVRVDSDFSITRHDGQPTSALGCYLDECGWLYVNTPEGLGLVHTQDMQWAANVIELGLWTPLDVLRANLAGTFGFVHSPAALHAEQVHQ